MESDSLCAIFQHGNAATSSEASVGTAPGGSVTSRAPSDSRGSASATVSGSAAGGPHSAHTGAKFRHGLLQLMIHTIDPLHDGEFEKKIHNSTKYIFLYLKMLSIHILIAGNTDISELCWFILI